MNLDSRCVSRWWNIGLPDDVLEPCSLLVMSRNQHVIFSEMRTVSQNSGGLYWSSSSHLFCRSAYVLLWPVLSETFGLYYKNLTGSNPFLHLPLKWFYAGTVSISRGNLGDQDKRRYGAAGRRNETKTEYASNIIASDPCCIVRAVEKAIGTIQSRRGLSADVTFYSS